MRLGLRRLRFPPARAGRRKTRPVCPRLEALEERSLLSATFVQTNLVSDVSGMAQTTDPNLVNPWGLTASPKSAFWVSDNGTGTSTLYNGQGQPQPPGNNPPFNPLVVTIPDGPNTPPTRHGTPTGTTNNTAGTGINVTENGKTGSSIFLFDTLDGTISGWSPGVDFTHAIVEVNNPGAVYTGLTTGTVGGQTLLYAANFAQGTIDVYNQNWQKVTTLAGNFTDPNVPADFHPFNVQDINNQLYVEYAKVDPKTGRALAGPGNGIVDVFNTQGQPEDPKHPLIVGGALDDPWGVALAPGNFGGFSNDLLVGNFGDGHINAFDPKTGKFEGTLATSSGRPFEEDHLWALRFGNGAGSGPTNTLFFTAGIDNEQHGLFGSLQAVPTLPARSPTVPNLGNVPEQTFTTVPASGDLNPYGVAFVPENFRGGGVLTPGDVLVSNFNDSANVQGTGSTIVRITPDGQRSVFFQGAPGLGLTTALGVLPQGFVVVGSVPTTTVNGQLTAQNGSLLILDSNGHQVGQLSDSALLQGPWDLAVNSFGNQAQVFVSDVLSGTVTRIDFRVPPGGTPQVESETQIASGFAHRTDPTALVVGPTGLAFDPHTDTLFVASTADNAVFAVRDAAITQMDHGTGQLVFNDPTHLHGPLGLTLDTNGDLIAANGDAVNPDPNNANELVEFTQKGKFVGSFQIDPGAPGAAFGLALQEVDGLVRFAAVNDNTNALDVWTFRLAKSMTTGEGNPGHGAGQTPHTAAHRHGLLDLLFSML
jgi:uncharacterized protein (TIGR03118 family)